MRRGLAEGADAIVVSGGVSVGPYDVVKIAFENDRPDRPVAGRRPARQAVRVRDARSGPTAGTGPAVRPARQPGLELRDVRAVRPARDPARSRAATTCSGRSIAAVLGEPVAKSHGRRAFLRVDAERDADGAPVRDDAGRVRVRLAAGGQGSHVISALAAADALAVIPEADDSLPAGAEVELWWLDRG